MKSFLYYNRETRSAILLLLILIALTLLLNVLLSRKKSSETVLSQNDSIINEFAKYRDSLNVRKYPEYGFKEENGPESYSTEISQDNSPAKQNRSITTKSHGFTNSAKVSSEWKTESSQKNNSPEINDQNSYSTNFQRIEKLKEGETISLNETDTTQWKKIPGIGSSYASRIIKYRNLLGGYVHKEQLMEVYGVDGEFYSRIESYIVADSDYLKLKVNQSDFRDLLRHPYLNYEQVQAIVNLRNRKGDIANVHELKMLEEFTPDDIARIEPYLQFM